MSELKLSLNENSSLEAIIFKFFHLDQLKNSDFGFASELYQTNIIVLIIDKMKK